MDQRGAGEITGVAERELFDQPRAAERAQTLRQQRFDLPAVADGRTAIGDGEIEPNGCDVAQGGDGRQPDPDLRVQADEMSDPRLQPFGGEARTARDEEVFALRLR